MKVSLNGALFAIVVSGFVGGAHATTTVCSSFNNQNNCNHIDCFWDTSSNPKSCKNKATPAAAGPAPTPAGTPATPAPTPFSCTNLATKANCEANSQEHDCYWEQTGNSPNGHCEQTMDHSHIACIDRGNQNAADCELDERCYFANNGNLGKSCNEVNRGNATLGMPCNSTLYPDTDGALYVDIEGQGCALGFMCTVTDTPIGVQPGHPIPGTCQPTRCVGKKVPGNCNGNNPKLDQCNSTTERVTICHRTCSRTNPWVRITIDEDAWDGEGCGHALQHDVRDECKNKAPWTEWGVNRRDYLIKRHGTRAEVETRINAMYNSQSARTAALKAYWRKWEPACPYVRNGACCSWDATADNACCGDQPEYACPFDMGETDGTICPGYDAVGVVTFKSEKGIIPKRNGFDPSSVLYDLSFGGDADAPTVTFKVNNPFDFSVDTYVQYHKKVGSEGALDPDCIQNLNKAKCEPNGAPITAGCIVPDNGEPPFSLVSVFFQSSNSAVFGAGGAGIKPYECCPVIGGKVSPFTTPVIEYTLKVLCACPDSMTGRRLQAESSDVELWQQHVGTGH